MSCAVSFLNFVKIFSLAHTSRKSIPPSVQPLPRLFPRALFSSSLCLLAMHSSPSRSLALSSTRIFSPLAPSTLLFPPPLARTSSMSCAAFCSTFPHPLPMQMLVQLPIPSALSPPSLPPLPHAFPAHPLARFSAGPHPLPVPSFCRHPYIFPICTNPHHNPASRFSCPFPARPPLSHTKKRLPPGSPRASIFVFLSCAGEFPAFRRYHYKVETSRQKGLPPLPAPSFLAPPYHRTTPLRRLPRRARASAASHPTRPPASVPPPPLRLRPIPPARAGCPAPRPPSGHSRPPPPGAPRRCRWQGPHTQTSGNR